MRSPNPLSLRIFTNPLLLWSQHTTPTYPTIPIHPNFSFPLPSTLPSIPYTQFCYVPIKKSCNNKEISYSKCHSLFAILTKSTQQSPQFLFRQIENVQITRCEKMRMQLLLCLFSYNKFRKSGDVACIHL